MQVMYIISFVLLLLFGCATNKSAVQSFDWDNFKKENPNLYISNRTPHNKKLSQHFVKLTEKEIKYVELSISKNIHLKVKPKALDKESKYFKWFQNEIDNIPLPIQEFLSKRVYGWTLVENLGASGTILGLYNEDHFIEKGIIILDSSVYKKTYLEMCSYKESTVYLIDKKESLECDFEGARISFAKSLIYHEGAHLFQDINPFFTNYMSQNNYYFFPFNRLSWIEHSHTNTVSKFDAFIPYRSHMKYYSSLDGTKLSNERLLENLEGWEKSNFFTLYSMNSHFEDWAETLTQYFVSKYHKGSYVVRYRNSKGNIKKYYPCSKNKDCSKKHGLIELFVKNIDLIINKNE